MKYELVMFWRLSALNCLIFNFKIRPDHKANRQQSPNKKERQNKWWSVWASVFHRLSWWDPELWITETVWRFYRRLTACPCRFSTSDSGSSRAHKLHFESDRVRSSSPVMWYPQLNYLLSLWTDKNWLRIDAGGKHICHWTN